MPLGSNELAGRMRRFAKAGRKNVSALFLAGASVTLLAAVGTALFPGSALSQDASILPMEIKRAFADGKDGLFKPGSTVAITPNVIVIDYLDDDVLGPRRQVFRCGTGLVSLEGPDDFDGTFPAKTLSDEMQKKMNAADELCRAYKAAYPKGKGVWGISLK